MNELVQPAFLNEQYALAAMKRWAPMLEGISNEYDKMVVARLLDNQKLQENATAGADVAAFNRIAYPLIRRVYPNLIGRELVSIQPISLPTSLIFYLDFKYGSQRDPIAAGQRNDYEVDEGQTIRDAANYSRGFVRGQQLGIGDGSETEFQVTHNSSPYAETSFTPLRDTNNLAVYVDAVPVTVVTTGTPGAAEVRVDLQTGFLTFGTAPVITAVVSADFDVRIQGDDSRIPEMQLSMATDSVTAQSRKLKFRWEIEAQQDLMAYHGLSIESELVTQAGDELMREIDRSIISQLDAAAVHNVNWATTWPGAGLGYDARKDYEETLLHAINDVSAEIYKSRLVNPNWIVTSVDVANRMSKINSFRFNGDLAGGQIVEGPHVFGTLQGKYRVIVDPTYEANKILVGYKGDQFFQTGFVFSPYVGLVASEKFMDPNDMVPRRSIMRRDAEKLISGDFYGTVTLT